MKKSKKISIPLLAWWDHDHMELPWRQTKDPYAIWVSEIMLQQTQIATVIPYYERWMARFPTVKALAAASLDEVLKLWEGLGYYSRARNLHTAVQTVASEYDGKIPQTAAQLIKLKGVGRYTAGAIASIAFDEAVPILDGNIIRVLSRYFDIEADVTLTKTRNQLWQRAASLVPDERPGDYNQALMELGQRLCLPKNPACLLCPLKQKCLARKRGTQLDRPVKPARKKTPHYDVTAGIIWRSVDDASSPDGHFLIAQRPLDGLLGGLWEFPGGKQEAGESLPQALRREIKEELDIDIVVGRHQVTLKHAYTHFRISLHAFHAVYKRGTIHHLGVADHAWVTLSQLESYAFAVTDKKIITSLQNSLSDLFPS